MSKSTYRFKYYTAYAFRPYDREAKGHYETFTTISALTAWVKRSLAEGWEVTIKGVN